MDLTEDDEVQMIAPLAIQQKKKGRPAAKKKGLEDEVTVVTTHAGRGKKKGSTQKKNAALVVGSSESSRSSSSSESKKKRKRKRKRSSSSSSSRRSRRRHRRHEEEDPTVNAAKAAIKRMTRAAEKPTRNMGTAAVPYWLSKPQDHFHLMTGGQSGPGVPSLFDEPPSTSVGICRDFLTGSCKNSNCRYSHSKS
mmetsp:Transcript_83176/g.152075  ORF Transcript_83176/g.152075 Transcript_83176/m.152075 type:complete len:194 (-) Transcript_83176:9-590(-)